MAVFNPVLYHGVLGEYEYHITLDGVNEQWYLKRKPIRNRSEGAEEVLRRQGWIKLCDSATTLVEGFDTFDEARERAFKEGAG